MPRYAIVQPESLDTNNDGRISPGELAGASLKGGLFVAIGLICTFVLAFSIITEAPIWARLILAALSLGLAIGSAIGAWRLLWAIFEVPHRWSAADRRRAIEAEEYERARLEGLEDDAGDHVTQAKIDNDVRGLLKLWAAGKPWQRGKVKGMSDPQWNRANDMLKRCGLRPGGSSKLLAENFAEAWGKYLEWQDGQRTFKVGDDRDLIAV